MRRSLGLLLVSVVPVMFNASAQAEKNEKVEPASRTGRAAIIETSMPTYQDFVPQLAYDGNTHSFFWSARPPKTDDTFTFTLVRPAHVKTVEVLTGKPDGNDTLQSGLLETSADGKEFTKASAFDKGLAKADLGGKEIKALRIRITADGTHRLAIREITLVTDANVPTFKWPVQFILDANEVPDLADWGKKVCDMAEEWYPVIAEKLRSDGYYPPRRVEMNFKKGSKGVAYTMGSNITCFEGWFKAHPDDIGAVFHEAAHVVQHYTKHCPGWVVEGIADYMRFWVYEYPPGPRMHMDPAKVKHDDSYRVTGAFFDFLTKTYDKNIVAKLNEACRKGKYSPELFKEYTGKDLETLGQEFKESLKKK